MSNVYCIKTKKKLPEDQKDPENKRREVGFYTLKMKDYTLKVIFQCPKGHLFAEEWHADKIQEYGAFDCLETSTIRNENILCPSCLVEKSDKK